MPAPAILRDVFLTYRDGANPASGPGRETTNEVSNYSVHTLDRRVVRLVAEEMARLPRAGLQAQQSGYNLCLGTIAQ